VRAHGTSGEKYEDISTRVVPVTSANRIKVTFNASVSDVLPWKFVPQQREVSVLPGETALAFYTATNKGDKDIIGVATYSVTPGQCAPYFSKIQCFCFEEQRLNAGETVDMPVFFYLDPDLLNDLNMRGVETVTLNYTFFSKLMNRASSVPEHSRMLTTTQKRDMTTMEDSSHLPARYASGRNLRKLYITQNNPLHLVFHI
jgi:cytochrome c oxidase assembly protein subunit 11